MSEEDKQALAIWLLDNPRGPPSTNQSYFERFMVHVSLLFSFRDHRSGSLCPVVNSNHCRGWQETGPFVLCDWKILTVVPQHKHLPARSWNTWMNAVNNHKDDIAARQHAVKKSRKRKQKNRNLSVSSVSDASISAFLPLTIFLQYRCGLLRVFVVHSLRISTEL